MEGKVKQFLVVVMFFMASGCLYSADEEAKFTRQECIQKVLFDWNGYDETEVERVIEQFTRTLTNLESSKVDIEIPGFVIPFKQRSELYLQYKQDCYNKKITTNRLIKLVIPSVSNVPKYVVTDEVVVPSPKTISLKGEYWREDDFE